MRKSSLLILSNLLLFWYSGATFAQAVPFTQDDRERLIRLETTLQMFMEATDKRFEQVDKRFAELREDTNNRFAQVDKRFAELREDMNQRFEQVNQRFEQMMTMLQAMIAIFTTLTLGVIGFAYWDRRTILQKAKAETREIVAQNQAAMETAIFERVVTRLQPTSERPAAATRIVPT